MALFCTSKLSNRLSYRFRLIQMICSDLQIKPHVFLGCLFEGLLIFLFLRTVQTYVYRVVLGRDVHEFYSGTALLRYSDGLHDECVSMLLMQSFGRHIDAIHHRKNLFNEIIFSDAFLRALTLGECFIAKG